MPWFAQAPSNIALIKYMGKKEGKTNLPINSSLSYTLNNLLSSVALETQPGKKDFWEPLNIPGALNFELSTTSQERFLNHLARLKAFFNYQGAFVVRSSNNFPHGSGLASSASSFAALTKCAVLALSELTNTPLPSIEIQASLSREGSGSSCRSFFSPWALWQEDRVEAIELPYKNLLHQVIIISHEEKKIPSSEAHIRIRTSPLYAKRVQRAENNLKLLLAALETKDWACAYQICWREFQDIHELFASSSPAFSYMTKEAREVLRTLEEFWQQTGDGPLVTMDAGPNIHLLYRPEQASMANQFKKDYLVGNYDVL
ncbi:MULTISPECIES: GHMP family kinase ATP-binding protein [Legionella]|uniref:Diphosphomevalonate decarboxylase n=1 Tax=Legionella septentrionalis TaxID=2498109 RepID=A0A433JLA5_9GAMM|nr:MULTISPECIES: diphosphomevalonate decarboxylase [Legionella]MCP0914614.1 diphosphomevalonate decarboxylase [Legionella sp. 27cVA30]RUQ90066.1 diphosphomevalonate decarboxylase [Legionella septentrionalis]RUQ96164.1 diphosphomevalonate decarboxylase [Legionella septentrionalis]RUR09358.1 diphosphomevalonate decarboxylase [Legionella septentrionalis]RUR14308.1 diphosphomevalonate decarboxylase [Legionella septentrionalis]